MKFSLFLFVLVVALAYDPTWESVDSRPLPSWFDEAKLGIFIHWGVYSVPSFGSEWYWEHLDLQKNPTYVEFHKKTYGEAFKYQDFAPMFKAEMYDPDRWAEVFQKSGAKYVVLTSKHHEGFANYPSKYSWNWNAGTIGPHRDLLGDLANAVRAHNMTFGTYYSLYEWFNPLYLNDKNNNFNTTEYIDKHYIPQIKELVNTYKPEIIWADGDWEAPDTYWRSPEFLAWLYNESPVKDTVVVNDRWGQGCGQTHGGYYSGPDRYEPGHLLPHKWENAMTIQKDSWGYDRNEDYLADKYFDLRGLLEKFIPTVAYGGNMLLNVGPTSDGRIVPIMQEKLIQLGEWLNVNGDAIYKTKPWRIQDEDKKIYYTQRENEGRVFAILTEWPDQNTVTLKSPILTDSTIMRLIGCDKPLEWKEYDGNVIITLPSLNVKEIPCQEMFVIEMKNIQ